MFQCSLEMLILQHKLFYSVKGLRRHGSFEVLDITLHITLDITLADHPELEEIVLNKSQRFGGHAFLGSRKLCYYLGISSMSEGTQQPQGP